MFKQKKQQYAVKPTPFMGLNKTDIGKRIQKLYQKKGLTQEKLAELQHCSFVKNRICNKEGDPL